MQNVKERKKEEKQPSKDYFKIEASSHLDLKKVLDDVEEKEKELFIDQNGQNTSPDLLSVIRFRKGECFVNWFSRNRFPDIESYDIKECKDGSVNISHEIEKDTSVEVIKKAQGIILDKCNVKSNHGPDIFIKKMEARKIKLFIICTLIFHPHLVRHNCLTRFFLLFTSTQCYIS